MLPSTSVWKKNSSKEILGGHIRDPVLPYLTVVRWCQEFKFDRTSTKGFSKVAHTRLISPDRSWPKGDYQIFN